MATFGSRKYPCEVAWVQVALPIWAAPRVLYPCPTNATVDFVREMNKRACRTIRSDTAVSGQTAAAATIARQIADTSSGSQMYGGIV